GYNSIDNQGFKILSRAHYSNNYENAFWDGQEMTYGDGGTTLYEMSGSLDVVAHEIDHGFTQFHANLNYQGQSGGMNESFSDIADGVKRAAKAWYTANAGYWTSTSSFTQGCQGVVDAAKSLKYLVRDIQALGDSWKDVGVTCNYPTVIEFSLSLDAPSKQAMA